MGSYLICDDKKIKNVDFAVTPKEQEKGLMFERDPKILVFLYTQPKIRKFWMKNCPNPLDIVFIKNNKIICIEKGIPNTGNLVGPDSECDFVVEFPFGYCEKNNLCIGKSIKLKLGKKILKKLFNLTTK